MVWQQNLPVIGSQSSPRTADLNEDGILDIVLGAGKNEYQHSKYGILALDGKTGAILWNQESPDQVYGSATFYDVTDDNVKDVFIGGRSPHFMALDGKTGKVIWSYQYANHATHDILQYARFNFNNSVLIADQDNDGLADLLTVNGGNAKAEPNSEVDRFPAVLMIFNSRTGKIIAADTMPDGKESYMAPLCFAQPGSKEYNVIFGTGGETIDGNLYIASLTDLRNKALKNAKIIASEKGHGFIAPPVVVDISGDGYYDIVAISHASGIFAIDGKSHNVIWKQVVKNTECSNSFGVGYFTDDRTPDFFTFVSKGLWPNSTGSLQIMLNGKDGSIDFMDSIGCTGFSSPVVYDINNDGIDEAIISINEFDCSLGFAGKSPKDIVNRLIAFDFMRNSVQTLDQTRGFKNIFSTPWLGDLDSDDYLDIVHCQYYSSGDLMLFLGMTIKRIDLPVRIRKMPVWTAYMASEGNGIFPVQKK